MSTWRINKPCAYCGKTFRTERAKFCSRDCAARSRRGQLARIENGIGIIPLNKATVALVDEADFTRVNLYVWHLLNCKRGNRYAVRNVRLANGKQTLQLMHRFVLGLTDDSLHTDHRDGNGLNNQRSNIRACIPIDNFRNKRKLAVSSSHFKGVTRDRSSGKWIAQIRVANEHIYLGRYTTEEDAARVYNKAARKHFGDFANLNQMSEQKPNGKGKRHA